MELRENNVAFFRSLTKKIKIVLDNFHKNFLKIGKITHIHGLKGECFVSFFSSGIDPLIMEGQDVQIRKGLELVLSSFVQRVRAHKKGMIVQLEGIENKTEVELLKGASFFVPMKLFSSVRGENIYLCEVLSFEVCDKKRGILGKVSAFSENGAQDLLLVQKGSSDFIEIPFIDEFIVHIDFKWQKINVDLPMDWPGLEY